MRRYGYIFLFLSLIPAVLFCHTSDTAAFWCARVLPCLRSFLANLTSFAAFPVCTALFLPFIALAIYCCMPRGRTILPYFTGLLVLSLSVTWLAPCALSENVCAPQKQQLQNLCKNLSLQAANCKPPKRNFDLNHILSEAARLSGTNIMPKPAVFPAISKTLGLAGWWSPLTSEAVVDATMSEINLPFVSCHELMHAQGVANEAQANYYAYLACMQGDEIFRYSGAMNALWYAMRCLRKADEAAWKAIVANMDADVYADFRRMNGLDEVKDSPISTFQDALTRLYLCLSGSDDYDAFAAWLVFSGNFA